MPYASLTDVRLYYESHGTGFPLVLIRGFGSNADHWYHQVPDLAARFRVIVFDNRGIARSSDPDQALTIPAMARDTKELMDFVGLDQAHVIGLSMGGMIAQELAISYPDRVAGLVLACTHAGGDRQVLPEPENLACFKQMVAEATPEAKQAAARILFAPRILAEQPEIAAAYARVSLTYPADAAILMRQWDAIQVHDTFDRLHRIEAPTLVLTGDADDLIPQENSGILADRIPDAELKVIPEGGHQVLVEQAGTCNRIMTDFLLRISGQLESRIRHPDR